MREFESYEKSLHKSGAFWSTIEGGIGGGLVGLTAEFFEEYFGRPESKGFHVEIGRRLALQMGGFGALGWAVGSRFLEKPGAVVADFEAKLLFKHAAWISLIASSAAS